MFTSPKQRRKRKFSVVFVVVAKKRSLHVQNLSFFIYLLGSSRLTFSLPPPVRRCSQDLSMVRNPNTFLVKCHSRFGSLMNYFVSLETDIWVERKKKSDVSEKIYFSKKQAELNELRKNVLLK